ncbi:MAG TPA: serine/threonine-protein kinase [Pirellulales bacterium]
MTQSPRSLSETSPGSIAPAATGRTAARTDPGRPPDCKETDDLPDPSSDPSLATSGEASVFDDPRDFLAPPTRPGAMGRLAQYDVIEVLGRGAFGIVLKAFDVRLQRHAAVKVLAPHLWHDDKARRRFLREARCAAAISDDHVVRIHAVSGDDDRFPYIVMEHIRGRTLQQRLDAEGPLAPLEVVRIAGQIAAGLAAAHQAGLIHRDVKPANVLLEEGTERVKLVDFGLARGEDDLTVTASSLSVAGTPMYMSPEQMLGRVIDHRSDLFSLGSVVYAMCFGRPPYHGDSAVVVVQRISEGCRRPTDELRLRVCGDLAEIVARLHSLDPAKRHQSAREAAECFAHLHDRLCRSGGDHLVPHTQRGATPQHRGRLAQWLATCWAKLTGRRLGESSK